MSRSWILYCFLLCFLYGFDITQGSSLNRIQYHDKGTETEARVIGRCIERVTSLLFEPSNRIVVIVSKNLRPIDTIMSENILNSLSINDISTVTLCNDFPFDNERMNPSSYLMIENSLESLYQSFQRDDELLIWTEYLILTHINVDDLKTFAASLRRRGFLKFAFLQINEINSILYNTKMEVISTLRIKNENVDIDSLGEGIRPFSSFICPAKGCYFTVGLVNNGIVRSTKIEDRLNNVGIGDHVVSLFASKLSVELNNRSLDNSTEAFDAIARNKVDMTYGNFIPSTEGSELLDIATWFSYEKVVFFDKVNITRLAPLTKVFEPLDIYVWLCIGTSITLYSFFAFLVKKIYEKKMINETIEIFHIWAILLGKGIRYPYNMGLRSVLGLWMITAFLINAAYLCAFTSSLSKRVTLQPIKTIDDVNHFGRHVVGDVRARRLFENSNCKIDHLIYEKFVPVSPDEVIAVAIKNHDVGVEYNYNVITYNNNNNTGRRRTKLYVIDEPVLVFPLNFYFKKRHPYLRTFRQVVIRARESGLIQKWHNDNIDVIQKSEHRQRFRRFLRHWTVSFKLWGAGNGIALIVFFYELCRGRRNGLTKNKL